MDYLKKIAKVTRRWKQRSRCELDQKEDCQAKVLLDLPTPVLLDILAMLSKNDRLMLSSVCKRLREIFMRDFCPHIDVNHTEVFRAVRQIGYDNHVVISVEGIIGKPNLNDLKAHRGPRHCIYPGLLRSINVYSDFELGLFIRDCECLQQITLRGVHIINEVVDMILRNKHLRFLDIIYCHLHPGTIDYLFNQLDPTGELGANERLHVSQESERPTWHSHCSFTYHGLRIKISFCLQERSCTFKSGVIERSCSLQMRKRASECVRKSVGTRRYGRLFGEDALREMNSWSCEKNLKVQKPILNGIPKNM